MLALLVAGCGDDREPLDAQLDAGSDATEDEGHDVDTAPTLLAHGAACTDDAACEGGTCLTDEDGYPGGYCTRLGCAEDGICSPDSHCAFVDAERTQSACFVACSDAAPCRPGYQCDTFGGLSFCLPAPEETEPMQDGAPCALRSECLGGLCLTEDDGFPGGHCTTTGCTDAAHCSGEATHCLEDSQPRYCVSTCETREDCREGYVCQTTFDEDRVCVPNPGVGTENPQPGDLPFEIVCDGTFVEAGAFQGEFDRHELRFTLSEGTTSFLLVPYTGAAPLYPVEIEGPNGTLNLFADYPFALSNPSFLINVTPLMVPQAPQFSDFVSGGDYKVTMAAQGGLCFYVLSKSDPGGRIDLNVHLVGARGITASTAGEHEGFQRALSTFSAIYGTQGVTLRNVRYLDVDDDTARRYTVVRSHEAVFKLVATSRKPSDDPDDVLSINVFLVDQFAIEGGGVLGVSAGLPGAAGFHGGRGSGLVFAASVLRSPELLGQVLAHEVGHYLGLFHTSESGGARYDPLEDTPECSPQQWRNFGGCPDLTNLMFPFAGNGHIEVTDGQGSVFHANPLVR
jgi:hypothetical protein